MTKTALLLIALSAVACKANDTGADASGAAGVSANAGSAGSDGTGGSAGAAAGAGGVGGGTGGSGGHVGCRTDLPGPTLIDVQGPGIGYCIDATLVTQGQYVDFLKAKGTDVSGQPDLCVWNKSYAPTPGGIDACSSDIIAADYQPAQHPDWPMVCVDYCDALAYCAWAGKRLCGRLAGAGPWPDPPAVDSPIGAELTYACTQGGKTAYLYGDQYMPDKSVGKPMDGTVFHGTMPPFDQLTGFNGLTQWEEGYNPKNMMSHARGQVGDATSTRCDAVGVTPAVDTGPSFRCCTDLARTTGEARVRGLPRSRAPVETDSPAKVSH